MASSPDYYYYYYVMMFLLLTSLVKVVTSNMKEMMMFQMVCNDDYSHIRSLSTDCGKFLMCSHGVALGFSCPPGYIFNDFVMRCHLPSNMDKARCSNVMLANMPLTCLHSPRSRVASYLSCAQYFDCSARPITPNRVHNYVTECPYPKLFSPHTGRCEPFQLVRCVGRTEPKAPCDYLQYQQLCEGSNCPPCSSRHPSCVGRSDGPHALGHVSRVYVVCLAERTVNIGMCKQDYVFSGVVKKCVSRASLLPPLKPLSPTQLSSLLSELLLTTNKTSMSHSNDDNQDNNNIKNNGINNNINMDSNHFNRF